EGVPTEAIRALRHAYATNFPQWLHDNARPFFVPETPESMLTWMENIMLQTSLRAVVELYDAVATTDFRKEMREISVPTLIVQGTKDASIPIKISGYKAAKLVKNSRFIVYENAPHGLPLTHTARLNRDLLDFIGASSG
ncbi:MAG TPA: alpha/beta hydrolase, partial [Noviherbaspirillum sp.]|nr:alpha/beta hydrolase [Noviherbaspirillum sp.]